MRIGAFAEACARDRLAYGRLALLCAAVLAIFGCTRRYYRDYADSDVYGILKERLIDWRWRMPERPVEADPRSRMADLNDPNHVPIVPDEVAARRYQVSARFPFEFRFWKNRGTTPIEDLSWQPYIPTEPDGKVLLSKDAIMRHRHGQQPRLPVRLREPVSGRALTDPGPIPVHDPGLQHLEHLLFALDRRRGGGGARAPAAPRRRRRPRSSSSSTCGSSTSGTTTSSGATTAAATATPKTPNLNNQLLLDAQNGFTWELMSGAQLLVNLANSLVFEYSNHGVQMVSPSLTVSLTQPLLAGAWARIVTQPLSLQERGVLYSLRSFAEFRRQFYVALVTGQSGAQYSSTTGYLALVGALQSIRNQEINVKSTKRNLDIYEAENRAGFLSILDVDTVAQQYQSALATLLSLQAGLQTQLDAFKINLGLPTELEVRIDDSILDQFELTDERLDAMRDRAEALFLRLLQSEELPRDVLAKAARDLKAALDELETIHDLVLPEHGRWQTRLKAREKQGFSGPDAEHDKEILQREQRLAEDIEKVLLETNQEIDDNQDEVLTFLAKLGETTPADATKALRLLVGKEFRGPDFRGVGRPDPDPRLLDRASEPST